MSLYNSDGTRIEGVKMSKKAGRSTSKKKKGAESRGDKGSYLILRWDKKHLERRCGKMN